MKQNKTAIIYCRVSTSKQGNHGDSLDNQEKSCKNYCKRENIKIIGEIYKDTFTGKQSDRPEFNKAIGSAILEQVDYFIVFDIDRFSREGYGAYSKLKENLSQNGIQLRDSKNIIGNERIVIQDDIVDMSKYKWNIENPTEMSEMVHSAQAKIEGNKIIQRTIPKEIKLEQNGYHVRNSNFGYKLKKIKTEFGNAKIQIIDEIEGKFIIDIFKLKSENKLSDEEIVNNINLLGYQSRKGKMLNIKQMQMYLKNSVYAGVISSKWTGNKAIRTAYDGLVSINTWNKVNRGKQKIIELNNGNVKIVKGKDEIENPIIKRRRKFNPDFPFRNLIKSSLIKGKLITGSFSNPGREKPTGYYHPTREKGVLGENIKKNEFESIIYEIFDKIIINPLFKAIFNDRFEKIFEENKKDIYKNKDILVNRLNEIRTERVIQENNIPNIMHLPRILESVECKLKGYEKEEHNIKDRINQLEANNYLNIDGFKNFCFNILEHLSILLKQCKNFEELQVIFKFVFKEIPTYNQIVNRTLPIYPIFSLNSKKEPQINGSSSLNLLWQSH